MPSQMLSNLAGASQSQWLNNILGGGQNNKETINQALSIALAMIQADRSKPEAPVINFQPPPTSPLMGAPVGGNAPHRTNLYDTRQLTGRLPDLAPGSPSLDALYAEQERARRMYEQQQGIQDWGFNSPSNRSDGLNRGISPYQPSSYGRTELSTYQPAATQPSFGGYYNFGPVESYGFTLTPPTQSSITPMDDAGDWTVDGWNGESLLPDWLFDDDSDSPIITVPPNSFIGDIDYNDVYA